MQTVHCDSIATKVSVASHQSWSSLVRIAAGAGLASKRAVGWLAAAVALKVDNCAGGSAVFSLAGGE